MAEAKNLILACRNEGKAVGILTLYPPTKVDAALTHAGYARTDSARSPTPRQMVDGVQLVCGVCGGNLWFRSADGSQFAAMLGAYSVES